MPNVFCKALELVNTCFLATVENVAMVTFNKKIRDAIAVGVLDIGTGTIVWIAVDTLEDDTQFIRVLSTSTTVRVKDAHGVFWKRTLEVREFGDGECQMPMRCITKKVDSESSSDFDSDHHHHLAAWPCPLAHASTCVSSELR